MEALENKVEEQENAEVEAEEMSDEAIENLSDENLDKLNDGDLEVEAPEAEASELDTGAAEPPDKGSAESEEVKTEEPESKTKGDDAPEKEEGKEPEGELKTVAPEDHVKLQQHSDEQAKYIQERGNEIGSLRAENSNLRKELMATAPQDLSDDERQRIDELYLESPTKAQEEHNRILAERRSGLEDKRIAEDNDQRSLSHGYLQSNAEGWEGKREELSEYMGEALGDKEFARDYLNDPYSDKTSGFVIQTMMDVLKARDGETAANAKVKELEGKLKDVQENLTGIGKRKNRLGNVASSSPEVVAESGELTEEQIEKLSDKELEAYLAKK